MRYSFHGKVRTTGQQVDGFVEAANSTQAIDRLADQGIIGVYSVRAEPKPPKNAVILAGQAEPEPEIHRLPGPAVSTGQVVASSSVDATLSQLMDKVSLLVLQVEKLLSRPSQVVYQSGPAREGGGGGKKRPGRVMNDEQNSTLRDIFQNNMDLRRSLDKLANTVGPQPLPKPLRAADSAPREMPAIQPAHEQHSNGRELQSQPAA